MQRTIKLSLALLVALMPFSGLQIVTPTAHAATNLLVNGGFEQPEVDTAQKWNIYPSGTPNLGWDVEWLSAYNGAPTPANLEIHENADATAPEGDQYAELDTDWDGPGGGLNNEPANVVISQEVQTCGTATYQLSYKWKPRSANGPHAIRVVWYGDNAGDGTAWSHSGTSTDYPTWQSESVLVKGTGGLDKLSIFDIGTPDSFGMYVDDFVLEQVTPCLDMCFVPGAVEDGFQYATTVVDTEQGLRKNGTPVNAGRSIPEQGLAYDAAQAESSFYSLGFDGWIIVSFTNPIFNGLGNDLKLTEDTWGAYPLEEADVYASPDGVVWSFLGTADNTNNVAIHTVSEFDLGALPWAKYVKIIDVTDPAPLPAEADGYDLNAVEALYSGVPCDPSISIDKEADLPLPYEVMIGETVTYTYAVTNDGNVPLMNIVVEDDVCSPVSGPTGDDGNGVLDVNETWNYQCVDVLFDTTTNIGTATAIDGEGTEVSSSDSITVAVKDPGCTLTQGYWKTHSENGPAPYDETWAQLANGAATPFFFSGQSYYQVLWTPPTGGNAYYILAHQYIAAKMNDLGGADDSAIATALSDAEALFGTYTPAEVAAFKGKTGNATRKQFTDLAGILGSYNEGLIGPGHCSEN